MRHISVNSAVGAIAAAGIALWLPSVLGSQPPSTLDQSRQYAGQLALGAAGQVVSHEIDVILDDFHVAASKADYNRYFSHWTEASVFLGTDATERWVGQEFRDYAKKRFDTGKGWTYHPHDRHITVAPDAEHAFFDELLSHDRYGTCRGSGVLRKEGGDWKILQYNLSIPIPNELAEGVVATIKKGAPVAPQEEKHKE
jgi:hypothetical protein